MTETVYPRKIALIVVQRDHIAAVLRIRYNSPKNKQPLIGVQLFFKINIFNRLFLIRIISSRPEINYNTVMTTLTFTGQVHASVSG